MQAGEQQEFRGGDWTDTEIRRFMKREAIFRNEGYGDAEKLAEQMLYRDRPDSGDNRRVCFECQHLRGKKCNAQNIPPLRFILQRCEFFALRGVKA